jgi:glucose dehydrogenase
MNTTSRTRLVLALMAAVLVLGLSACRSNGYKQPGTTTGASPQPQTATAASQQADWPSANLDYANTRAATGSTINSATVGQLATAWSFPIPGVSAYGAAATTPIISGNTVYFQDLQSNVYALDFTSGALKWHKDYNLPVEGPNGPALANGRLFVAAGPHALAAIDAETGVEIWSTTLTHSDGEGIDIQPGRL